MVIIGMVTAGKREIGGKRTIITAKDATGNMTSIMTTAAKNITVAKGVIITITTNSRAVPQTGLYL